MLEMTEAEPLVTDLASECQGQVCPSHEAGLDAGHLRQLGLEAPDGGYADAGTHGHIYHPQLPARLPDGIQSSAGKPPAESLTRPRPSQPSPQAAPNTLNCSVS